jgi:hypothetical protein
LAAIVLILSLASCSSQKTISPQDLRSKLTMATSLAAESEAFLDVVAQGRSTATFAIGHAQYLSAAARRLVHELDKPAADANLEHVRQDCRDELSQLARALKSEDFAATQAEESRDTHRRIAAIHSRLERLKASL